MIKQRLYTVATVLIVAGIAMLCQPFFFVVHASAFPVLLIGVVLFMILDHLPEFNGNNREDERHR
jgi:uncharacterized membrane protein YadS